MKFTKEKLKENLHTYAKLLLQRGVALKENQPLLINGEVESKDFINILTEEAYKMGASDVTVNWRDGFTLRQKLLYAKKERLENPKSWISEYYKNIVDDNTAVISLVSANPKLLSHIPLERITTHSKNLSKVTKFYHEKIMSSALTWCVAAVATPLWANLLNLEVAEEEQVNKLWELIFTFARISNVIDGETFDHHMERLNKRTTSLQELQLKELQYTCPNGTNLSVLLPDRHIWQGGAERSKDGTIFNANIPTEEVFTAPLRTGINGIVKSTKPLIYQGNKIDSFTLEFENGKVISFDAAVGKELLGELLATDEGSSYLGEIALVDHFSPISQSNKIYFETLFDENASCHLAFGAAYPTCLEKGDTLTEDELLEKGLNQSLTHVDFMIGHHEMDILGITHDNERVQIMKQGKLYI